MLTSDDITQVFTAAGYDTPDKLATALTLFSTQIKIKKIDGQIEALGAARTLALAPVENQRIDLQNQRDALVAQLAALSV